MVQLYNCYISIYATFDLNKYDIIFDGLLGGICNVNTSSGCLDQNAECTGSICQCSGDFTNINGICMAGKCFRTLSHTYLLNDIAILFKSHLKHNYVAFLCKCMI